MSSTFVPLCASIYSTKTRFPFQSNHVINTPILIPRLYMLGLGETHETISVALVGARLYVFCWGGRLQENTLIAQGEFKSCWNKSEQFVDSLYTKPLVLDMGKFLHARCSRTLFWPIWSLGTHAISIENPDENGHSSYEFVSLHV